MGKKPKQPYDMYDTKGKSLVHPARAHHNLRIAYNDNKILQTTFEYMKKKYYKGFA